MTEQNKKNQILKLKRENSKLVRENKELLDSLGNTQDERSNLRVKVYDLKKKVKELEMYKKASSVLLAAVDERRLMWSLAKEYDRMKLQDDFLHGGDLHKFAEENKEEIKKDFGIEDIFKENKEGAKQEEKKTEKELNINLDDVFDSILGKLKTKK